ncbi:hypothetical protein AB0M29_27240 [Streptomyces sp. NPDC051976]|uniref:hypothetical protein n=1 Tax=Streptomyces sp. NPDC051976 TaxID=3154947 RepID=UPI003415F5FE
MNNRRRRGAVRKAVVVAIAVAASAMPLVSGGTAVADAPSAGHRTAAELGTVEQVGDHVPVVTEGEAPSTTIEFDATLPASVTGQVHARLDFDGGQLPSGGAYPWRVAPHLQAQCAVNGADSRECGWDGPFGTPDQGKLLLNLPTVAAATTLTYVIRLNADYYALPDGQTLSGAVELTDADGAPLATGSAVMRFRAVLPDAEQRPALHARDASGVLWSYEGTGDTAAPFKPRTRIGGGWNTYDQVTALSVTTAAGEGDVVARDRNGVLWYYGGTRDVAAPFKPRVRVGGGWNTYTEIFGAGAQLDERAGGGDLLARDKAGDLWFYQDTGNPAAPFAPRVKVGWGWNTYTEVTPFGNGVLARDSSGVLWSYGRADGKNPAAPLMPRVRVGGGWNAYTSLTGVRDAAGAQFYSGPSLLARDRNGKLWLYKADMYGTGPQPHPTAIGGGWNTYTLMF